MRTAEAAEKNSGVGGARKAALTWTNLLDQDKPLCGPVITAGAGQAIRRYPGGIIASNSVSREAQCLLSPWASAVLIFLRVEPYLALAKSN
jgi:hypothetical protein